MANAAMVPVVHAPKWRGARQVFVQGQLLGYVDAVDQGSTRTRCWLIKSTNNSVVLLLPTRTAAILELIRWHKQHPEGKLYDKTPIKSEHSRLVVRARVCRGCICGGVSSEGSLIVCLTSTQQSSQRTTD